MELKTLVKKINTYIQPFLQNLLDANATLSNTPPQQLLWNKIAPLIEYEIKELEVDPKDMDTLNAIPSQIKKSLKSNQSLQAELIAIVQQIQQTEASDTTNISNSKNVVNNSTIQTDGNIHIGDNSSTNNHGNIEKQLNIRENKGDINFDNSITNQPNISNNGGTIHIGDIINIQRVIEKNPLNSITNQQTIVQQIHQLISTNKIKQALEKALQFTKNKDPEEHNQIILLTNRWNRLKQNRHAGIITTESGNIEHNRITAALLSFMEDFT